MGSPLRSHAERVERIEVKYLLDTHAMTAWVKKDARFLAQLERFAPADLGISVMTEHEIRYGIACNPGLKTRVPVEHLLSVLPRIPVSTQVASRAATLRADLRQKGLPIGPYDLLIAATGLAHNLTVITHNTREFNRVPDLRVEDWQ